MTQMRQITPGGSKTETRAYDSFQRMTSMTTFDGTAIAYNYSPTANDGKLVSQVTGGETVNYTYDVLGRLSQAATAGAGGWGMSWTYDGWGNRLQQSAVKGSVPTMVSITDPATNRIQAHTYDANGNTVNTPQQGAMTYDVINRLKTVAADTYGYDPSNKRIWKNDEYTFWGAAGERIGRYSAVKLVDDAGTHIFVFQKVQVDEYFGGRRLTTQDRLGSVGAYYPYGEARSGTVSNADSFATYYRDGSGLDYAQQRYYASGSGRFLTPDPAGSGSNWYAYVSGDPMNGLDPKGLNLQGPQDSDTGVCEAQFSSCGPGIGYRSGGGGGGGGNWDYSGGCGAGSFASAGYCFPLPIPIVIYEPPVPPPSCGAQLVIAVRNFLTLRMPSLVPYAGAIAATGASYNIDPRLIAAMAVAENGQATNNPFGLGPNGSTAFASMGAALAQLGRTLDIYIYRWNETSVSQLWSGNTWKVEPKKPWITTQYPGYCVGTSAEAQAGCQATGNNISGFMTSMSGNPNQLGYPCPD